MDTLRVKIFCMGNSADLERAINDFIAEGHLVAFVLQSECDNLTTISVWYR